LLVDAQPPSRHEPVKVCAANPDEVGSMGKGGDDVVARHDAGVEVDLKAITDGIDHRGQGFEGHWCSFEVVMTGPGR